MPTTDFKARAVQLRKEKATNPKDPRLLPPRPPTAAAQPSEDLIRLAVATLGLAVWRPRMPGQKGLRILCIDGGGTRGVLTIALMKAICKACGGGEIHDYFDVICGTSTGAILSGLLGVAQTDIEDCENVYDELIPGVDNTSGFTVFYFKF